MKVFCRAACGVLALLLASNAHAGIDKMYSPQVVEGEWGLEYSGIRTSDHHGNSFNNAQGHEVEFEYGLTPRLKLGLVAEGERESPDSFRTTGAGLEAQYEMTSQKDWWLSSGILGEYMAATHSADPDAGELKLLLQRYEASWNFLANIGLAREFGNNRASGVALASSLQGTYRINRYLAPGLEWHADYGNVNHLQLNDKEGQYIGPIVKGALVDFGNGALRYTAGYYAGLTAASANHAARLQLEYEWRF